MEGRGEGEEKGKGGEWRGEEKGEMRRGEEGRGGGEEGERRNG